MSLLSQNTPSGLLESRLDRRRFFRQAGMLGLGAAAAGLALPTAGAQATSNPQHSDTTAEILTAALIAEDLATTFYYNSLVGKVIEDPSLAGSGGRFDVITNGNQGNVQ